MLGPGHVNGVPNSPQNLALLHGDLLGPFVPGYLQRFAVHGLFAPYQLHTQGTYLGIPFLVAVGLVTVLLRRRGIVAMAGTLAAIALVLSLGSTLYVDGDDTHVPLPFAVLAHLPFFDGLLALRLVLYTALFGGAVVSIGLDTLYRRIVSSGSAVRSSTRRRVLAIGVALAVTAVIAIPLLPAHAQPATPSATPAFFTSPAAGHDIPAGSTVLAYPYPDAPVFPGSTLGYSYSPRYQDINDVLLDQAASGVRFKLIGGYGWRRDGDTDSLSPSVLFPTSVNDLFDFAYYGVTTRPGQAANLVGGHLTTDLRSFLRHYGVSTVIVLPVGSHPAAVTAALVTALGAPSHRGGVDAWFDVQRLLTAVSPTESFRISAPPAVTKVVRPPAGASLSGHQYLVASASAALGVGKVQFEISGNGRSEMVLNSSRFPFGWIGSWDTVTVPNGTYTLRSRVTDATGAVTVSAGVVVRVRNVPP